ncbi:MAG: cation transporter [Promethearchaeota archaeon]
MSKTSSSPKDRSDRYYGDHHRRHERSDVHDILRLVLIALKESPLTYQQIISLPSRLTLSFGFDVFFYELENIPEVLRIEEGLSSLVKDGLIQFDGEVYSLTELGREQAEEYSKGIYKFFQLLNFISKVSLPPILSLVFHLFLGTLKIAGFLFTGSVSLLSDGIDSVMDGITSIGVSIGIRIKKEAAITYLLVLLMIISGLSILLEGVTRVIFPLVLEEESIVVIIAIIGILLCLFLYFYQRFIGVYRQNLAILAQSTDSRNHVFNGLLVLVAVVAGNFQLYFIDGLVACFIGLLILKGAYELFQDLRAQAEGEEIDYEKYKLIVWKRYDQMQDRTIGLWLLHKVQNGSSTLGTLKHAFDEDFQPIIIRTGEDEQIIQSPHKKTHLKKQIKKLEEEGLLKEYYEMIEITEKGTTYLKEKMEKIKAREERMYRGLKRKRERFDSSSF